MSEVPSDQQMRFNRQVPEALVTMLVPDGAFSRLPLMVREAEFADRALDLQLRAIPTGAKGPQMIGRATLYVGLTKALDLEVSVASGTFRVVVPVWENGRNGKRKGKSAVFKGSLEEAVAQADEIVERTIAAIHETPPRWIQREGWIQARIGAGREGAFAGVDRESALSFSSEKVSHKMLVQAEAELTTPVVRRLAEANHGWAQTPWKEARERLDDPCLKPSFGGELDAVGVDARGRVLLIEVKSGSDDSGVGWTPLQVARYVYLFRRWAEADPMSATAAINAMLAQRERIGLLPPGNKWRVAERRDLELVPVIAIGGEVQGVEKSNSRMETVRDAVDLVDPDLLRGLEVWQLDREEFHTDVGVGQLQSCPIGSNAASET